MKKTKLLITSTILTPLAAVIPVASSCANVLNPSRKDATVIVKGYKDTATGFVYDIYTNDGTSYAILVGDTLNRSSTTITLSDKVTYNSVDYNITGIGDYVFAGYTKLETLVFPSSNVYKSIGKYAFNYCTKLKYLTNLYSNNIETIDDYAFRSCKSLPANIVFNPSLKTIGTGAFQNCTSIETFNSNTSLTSLTKIGDCAFEGCTKLVKMAEHKLSTTSALRYIGSSAFRGCSKLNGQGSGGTGFLIDAKIEYIGPYAFEGCDDLHELKFEKPIYWSNKGSYESGAVAVENPFKPSTTDDAANMNAVKNTFKGYGLTRYTPVSTLTIINSLPKESYDIWDKPRLTLNIEPAAATVAKDLKIQYDSSLATMAADGTVTFKSEAKSPEFSVTANDGSGKTASSTLNVVKCPIKSISWDAANPGVIFKGSSKYIKANIELEEGSTRTDLQEVEYFMEDTDNTGATLNPTTGYVTAGNGSGNIKVWARSKYLPDDYKLDPVTITVGTTLMFDKSTGILSGFNPAAFTQAEIDAGFPSIKGEFPDGKLVIPEGTKSIAAEAFKVKSTSSTEYTYPISSVDFSKVDETLTEIGDSAFHGKNYDTYLKGDIVLPNSLKTVGAHAFEYQDMSSLTFGPNLVSVGEYFASFGGNDFKTVTFNPECPLTQIPAGAFRLSTALGKVVLPNKINLIESRAFDQCTYITQTGVVCPNQQTQWYYYDGTTNVMVDSSDAKVFAKALRDNSLHNFNKMEPTPEGKVLYSVDTTSGKATFSIPSSQKSSTDFTSLIIPAYVEKDGVQYPMELPTSGVNYCNYLETIVLPSTITALPKTRDWLSPSNSLKNINLSKITYIPEGCFDYCAKLSTVDLSSLTDASEARNAFRGCSSLTSVTFGKNLTSLQSNMFYGCSSLQTIDLSMCTSFVDGKQGSHGATDGINSSCFEGCSNVKTLKLPPTLLSVCFGEIYHSQFKGLGSSYKGQDEGCYVEFPAGVTGDFVVSGTWNDNSEKGAFVGSYVTKIKTDSSSIYNSTRPLGSATNGGLLTNLKSILIPTGATPNSDAYIRATLGFVYQSTEGNYDIWAPAA